MTQRLGEIDRDLYLHASLVASYVTAMCSSIDMLSEHERASIVDAAWLHDIGKLTISPVILRKAGPLTEQEWDEMREHPTRAANYLDDSSALSAATSHVRQHHEWHNGDGYPSGLSGAEISLGARLIEVADAYDAMTSWRPYRPKLSDDAAIGELRRCAGSQFDPEIVELFVRATKDLRTTGDR